MDKIGKSNIIQLLLVRGIRWNAMREKRGINRCDLLRWIFGDREKRNKLYSSIIPRGKRDAIS